MIPFPPLLHHAFFYPPSPPFLRSPSFPFVTVADFVFFLFFLFIADDARGNDIRDHIMSEYVTLSVS